MPPTKCSQRNSIKRFVLKSVGKLISVKVRAPVLKLCPKGIVDGWPGKGNLVDRPGMDGNDLLGASGEEKSLETFMVGEVEKRETRPYCRSLQEPSCAIALPKLMARHRTRK